MACRLNLCGKDLNLYGNVQSEIAKVIGEVKPMKLIERRRAVRVMFDDDQYCVYREVVLPDPNPDYLSEYLWQRRPAVGDNCPFNREEADAIVGKWFDARYVTDVLDFDDIEGNLPDGCHGRPDYDCGGRIV